VKSLPESIDQPAAKHKPIRELEPVRDRLAQGLLNPHYHEPTDTASTLDYEFARDCVHALLLGAYAYTSICAASGIPEVN